MSKQWSDQLLQSDLLLVAQPDTNKPFASKKDAFDRLLSYHIFAREESKSKTTTALDRARSLTDTVETARKKAKLAHETLLRKEQADEFRNACELCYLESSLIQQEKVKTYSMCSTVGCTRNRGFAPLLRERKPQGSALTSAGNKLAIPVPPNNSKASQGIQCPGSSDQSQMITDGLGRLLWQH